MHKQRGLSLIGFMIIAALAGGVLLIGFKSVPAINEYMAVKRVVGKVVEEGNAGATIPQMRYSFDSRALIDNITTIKGTDLDIFKDGGNVVIKVKYAREVPITSIVSLLFNFDVDTEGEYR